MLKIETILDENGTLNINFAMKLPVVYKKSFDIFFSLYEIINLQPNNFEKRELKSRKERTCRFCGKSYPEVTFKKKAHIIPELLGRSSFVSDFECDACNHHFSLYETDLAAFVGISRSLSRKKGKEGTPTYKSNDKNLEIRGLQDIVSGNRIQIFSSDFEKDIVIDKKNKTLTINAERKTFIPLRVYKALVKIALTLLPENGYNKYSKLVQLLFQTDEDKNLLANAPFCRANIYLNPGPEFPLPQAIICQKLQKESLVLTHSLLLYFSNYIYQIFLPFNDEDEWMYDGNTNIEIPVAPPFIDQSFVTRFGQPQLKTINLSSPDKNKAMLDRVVMSYENIDWINNDNIK